MQQMPQDHRKATRIALDKGVAVLSHVTEPAIACPLLDLSASGCSCDLALPHTAPALAQAWKELLKPGTRVRVELHGLPDQTHANLQLEAEATHVETSGERTSVGFKFVSSPAAVDRLKADLTNLAVEKVSQMNANLLVGKDGGNTHLRVADMLAADGAPQAGNIAVHAEANATNTSVSGMLFREKTVSTHAVCNALSILSGIPVINLAQSRIPVELTSLFSFLTMQRYEFVPFAESKEMLCIAAAHPLPGAAARNELERIAKRPILVFLAPIDQIHDHQFRNRPHSMQKERNRFRVKSHTAVTYQFCDEKGVNLDPQIRVGWAIDMSESGFLITGPAETLHTPEELLLRRACVRVELTCGEKSVHALCKIRHCEISPSPADPQLPWKLGVELSQIDANDATRLKDLISHAALEHMKLRGRGFNPDES